MAETSRARHDIVLHFLRALGVRDTTARIDAEGMEHHVSDETLAIMQRFTKQQQNKLSRYFCCTGIAESRLT